MDKEERYSRQKQIVPPDKLDELSITVVGTGAIGRNVAIQLASIGVNKLNLFDFDNVEESNIASQGFMESDIGKLKVDAVDTICKAINSEIKIVKHATRYKKSSDVTDVTFLCVDSMGARKFIWEKVKEEGKLLIDSRMSAEVLRILSTCLNNEKQREHYESTLFSDEQSYSGSCTAKTTIYCANIAAGLCVGSLTKYLRNIPDEQDTMLILTNNEMICGKEIP